MSHFAQVFVDVDTQFDFIDPTGKLYVPGAERLIPAFDRLFVFAKQRGIRVISSADNHAPEDPEFARFPPHCVRGTSGQARIRQTLLPSRVIVEPDPEMARPVELFADYQQIIFHKAAIDVFTNPNAGKLVERLDADDFIVFGVATDYCVLADVLGLRQRGKRVRVVRDAIKGISEDTARRAVDDMMQAGAKWTTVAEVIDSQ